MSTPRTSVEEKVGAWAAAFTALREEITPSLMREVLTKMQVPIQDPNTDAQTYMAALQSYIALARLVTANDRAAALAAAMMVSAGVKPVLVEGMSDDLGD